MNKNQVIIAGVVLVLVVGAVVYYRNSKQSDVQQQDLQNLQTDSNAPGLDSSAPASNSTESAMATPNDNLPVKQFTVTGSNFKFEPSELKVNKGDNVKITFQNSGGTHDFVIDELNAKTKRIGSGEQDTIEFVADKTGTFEFYCSVGKHREMGMKGTLTVE